MLSTHRHVQDASHRAIDYAPLDDAAQARARIARIVRRVFWIAIVVLAAATGWRLVRQAQYLYWQQQCMTFVAPADREIVLAAAPSFLGAPRSHTQLFGAAREHVFMHERQTPQGEKRLVAVQLEGGTLGLSLHPAVYIPATINPKSTVKPVRTGSPIYILGTVQVFAGQPDTNDPSHFSIRVVKDDEQGVLDCWLGDDDSVRIEPRAPWNGSWRKPVLDLPQ